jgi:hypothetical protein
MSAAGNKGVTYRGLNELISFNKNLNNILTQATNDAFRQQSDAMLGATQKVVPVRTGRLKRSGGKQIGNLFLSIFYDAPYARFVDLGTSRFAGRHYFFRVLEGQKAKMIGSINQNVGKQIKTHLGRK